MGLVEAFDRSPDGFAFPISAAGHHLRRRPPLFFFSATGETSAPCMMAAFPTFASLAPKTKNLIVAGGLTAFVFGVYFYTMKAVGGTDELQVAIDKFEEEKHKQQDQPGSQAG